MSKPIAVINARLIDGTGAEAVDNATVLMAHGRFSAVGPTSSVEVPEDAHLIDAASKTVMPGLVEGHAHISGSPASQRVLRLALQRGITTICSPSANLDGIKLRDGIESGHIRNCARVIAGCVVAPTFGHIRFRNADGPWEVRKAVREMVQAGADFIKTAASGGFWAENERCSERNYTLEELEALVDEAHAWHRPVVVHAHTQPGINNSIAAGVDQIHHGAFIDEEGVRGMLEHDLWFVPTLHVTSDRNIRAWPDRPWMAEEMRQSQPVHRAGVKLAHELGVKIAFGCDYPGAPSCWALADSTYLELQELAQCGLSAMEAIVAATKSTAEAYRLDDIGTVEAGKRADLLVVDCDPLADLGALADGDNINIVIKDGRVESTDEAHKEHYRVREDQPSDRFSV